MAFSLSVSVSINTNAQGGTTSSIDVSNYTKLVDILPPSPNAAALGRYGGVDVGLSTGMINLNIPLIEYSSTNIHLPIALNYTSSGFKVDEISSRTGNGWILNAGGVITRTVYGNPDESTERVPLTANFPQVTRAMIDSFLENVVPKDGEQEYFDSQADLFSFNFNGYSGKFILDDNKNIVLLNYSSLKIEKISDWSVNGFKITTPDGVKYYFGGQSAIETTNRMQSGVSCGRIYYNYATTAWYLNKIIHPDNDTIFFNYSGAALHYTIGINQTGFARNTAQKPAACFAHIITAPTLVNTTCASMLTSSVKYLDEINSSSGGKLKFTYINRKDIDDQLLSKIEWYQPGKSVAYKIFAFNYNYSYAVSFPGYNATDTTLRYRPFLASLIETTPNNEFRKTHEFVYNDIAGLPYRLSYAQDAYGYFNGEHNNTLLPKPTTFLERNAMPFATANRSSNPQYETKGMLSKIIYPTGGQDSIIYDGNTEYKQVDILPPLVTLSATSRSEMLGSENNTSYSDTATINFDQEIELHGSCSSYGTPEDEDAIHNKADIFIVDENNNAVFSTTLHQGDIYDKLVYLNIAHTYQIKVIAHGQKISVSASFSCYPGNKTFIYVNQIVGGLRVSKVMSNAKSGNGPMVKKYYYGKLSSLNVSTGGPVYVPNFSKYFKAFVPCNSGAPPFPDAPGIIECSVSGYDFYSLYSNSQNNLYLYSSAPIYYGSVIESFGENFENGGIQHEYHVESDIPGNSLLGDNIMSAPLTSSDWRNGREIHTYTFKKLNTTYIPVKEVFTHFKEDNRVNKKFRSYVANKKYVANCIYNIPSEEEAGAYDLMYYSRFQKWVYPDTVLTLSYADDGQSSVEEKVITAYGNVNHALPTRVTTFSSKNETNVAYKYYPFDVALTGSAETARQVLISKSIISPVLEEKLLRNDNQLYDIKTDYQIFPNGLVLPESQNVQVGNNAIEKRISFTNYDLKGKLLEQQKPNDVITSYLWGYNHKYPVAQVIGASYTIISGLVNQTVFDDPLSTEALVQTQFNSLRAGLANSKALVTTYTYDPLIGMTSQTDAKNMTMHYEYDDFARLKLIRDKDRSIVKSFQYQYAGSTVANTYQLEMQTFARTKTLGYPVGVFNVKGELIGNARDSAEFVIKWNSDTADQHTGGLSVGSDPLVFNLALTSGKTLPKNVTGLRYYQFDLACNKLDAVRNENGAYVDFGDGFNMRLGKTRDDRQLIKPDNTIVTEGGSIPYIIHTYANNDMKTVTLYHNDAEENNFFDNHDFPATSLTLIRNLRGILPLNTTRWGGSCYQSSSAFPSASTISNWSFLHGITSFGLSIGDGINDCRNLNVPQDFFQNHIHLQSIATSSGLPYGSGYADPSFTIAKLKSDWTSYFKELNYIKVSINHLGNADLSELKNLKYFLVCATNQNNSNDKTGYNPVVPIPTAKIDQIINQIRNGGGQKIWNGFISINSCGPQLSAASKESKEFLESRGWTVEINNFSY